jgi:hypothetical protein
MSARESSESPRGWLAITVRTLLEEKYGAGQVPGVRRLSADIGRSNDGDTISHGHVHNILNGDAQNLTDHTRTLLARFFGKHPSYFYPPREAPPLDPDSVHALAARLATFSPAQVAAIREAIDIISGRSEPRRSEPQGG